MVAATQPVVPKAKKNTNARMENPMMRGTSKNMYQVCTEIATILVDILRTEALEGWAGIKKNNRGRWAATEEPGTWTPNLSLTTTQRSTILARRQSDKRDLW